MEVLEILGIESDDEPDARRVNTTNNPILFMWFFFWSSGLMGKLWSSKYKVIGSFPTRGSGPSLGSLSCWGPAWGLSIYRLL